jgi:preprotein translocase subunit SecB
MMPSPIQLLQLTFKRIAVEIDPRHAPPEAPNPVTTVFVFDGVSITTEVGSGELDMAHERGPMYMVSLRVLVDNQPSDDEPNRKFSPYLIDIETAGVVLLRNGAEKLGSPRDLVIVNGASLLWSAIREQLLTLTSRMPVGPVMLPTVHFHDLKQASPANEADSATAAPVAPVKKVARVKGKSAVD